MPLNAPLASSSALNRPRGVLSAGPPPGSEHPTSQTRSAIANGWLASRGDSGARARRSAVVRRGITAATRWLGIIDWRLLALCAGAVSVGSFASPSTSGGNAVKHAASASATCGCASASASTPDRRSQQARRHRRQAACGRSSASVAKLDAACCTVEREINERRIRQQTKRASVELNRVGYIANEQGAHQHRRPQAVCTQRAANGGISQMRGHICGGSGAHSRRRGCTRQAIHAEAHIVQSCRVVMRRQQNHGDVRTTLQSEDDDATRVANSRVRAPARAAP